MRIKAKNVAALGLQLSELRAEEEKAAASAPAPPPYRLVGALSSEGSQVPAVLIASNGQARQAAAGQPSGGQQRSQQLPASAPMSRQLSGVGQPENSTQQTEPQPTTATGRPVRKRKTTAFGDDMIPTDALLSRRSRFRGAAGPPPSALHPSLLSAAHPALPTKAPLVGPSAAAAAAPAGLPAGIKLVTVPAPGGGTVTGLAIQPGALLALPGLQQQLLRAQAAAGAAGGGAAAAAPLLGPMPYRVIPVEPAANGSRPAVPAVRVAAPRDIVRLARQLDEEERRKALAVSDAHVMLRVLPGGQAAGKGAAAGKAVHFAPGSQPATGRGRGGRGAGRSPRRPTPELQERKLDLPPGTWHPGFEVFGGITHINVLKAATAPHVPAVVVRTPPRCSEAVVQDPTAQFAFSEDPLRSSLEFLRESARTVGQLPHYSASMQAAVAAEQRLYKERLGRMHYARDGRRLGKDMRVEGTRKSVRTRGASEGAMPPPPPPGAAGQQQSRGSARTGKRQSPRPEDETDVRRGAEFQAQVPALRPRPAQPSEEEARWAVELPWRPQEAPTPQYDAQQAASMPAASAQERAAWVSSAHNQLAGALGEERAAALGLLAMGSDACQSLLAEEEEAALEAGMREFGRAFHTIQLEQVPRHTVFDLQNYYYNVWKLRSTPRSKAWYEEKAVEEAARQAEQERLERVAAAEQEAQREKQESRYKRRMLREALQWLRAAARSPAEVQHRGVVVQRAQRAAALVGSLNASTAKT